MAAGVLAADKAADKVVGKAAGALAAADKVAGMAAGALVAADKVVGKAAAGIDCFNENADFSWRRTV
jgi:hypothetical protein